MKIRSLAALPGIVVFISVNMGAGSVALAQAADDLAIPVRKGASEKPQKSDKSAAPDLSKKAGKSETPKKSESISMSDASEKPKETDTSSSTGDPDLAAVANLRPRSAQSNASESAEPAEPDEQVGPSESDIPPPSQVASVALPPMAPVSATVPARIAPNLYLAQPEPEKTGGFLSRLLSRKKKSDTAAAAAPVSAPAVSAQSNFTSDYATRNDSMILPAVLDGNGWNGVDLPIGGEDPYRLASLPSTFRPTDLVKLPVQTCHYGNQLYLRREAAISLMNMINAAACEGLTLRVVSAFRDGGHQARLYNKAVARGGINQKMVARPGKSEHNLGTTVDLTNNEKHALQRSFGDTPEGRWLAVNAARYGWKMTVMNGNGRRSHDEEPWHLRYLGGSLNGFTPPSTVAQQVSPPQRRDIFGSIGRFLHLRD